MSNENRIWLITGASSGFGRALALEVLGRGEKVALAARRVSSLEAIASQYPDTAIAVPLDVTNPASRDNAVAAVIEKFGRIDVLANIAGQGSLGAAEEFSDQELRSQMEVNFFGLVSLTLSVLPQMKKQRSGHILNLTSVGGIISGAGFSAYCASKFAVEGWSEALRDEVAPHGINVTLIEPGAFRTEFAGQVNMRPSRRLPEYRAIIRPVEEYLYGSNGQQPGDPAKAARVMLNVADRVTPPLRVLIGADAYQMWHDKLETRQEDFSSWKDVAAATDF